MTADLHASFEAEAQGNPDFAGVLPVGDAFQRAVDEGVAKADGFYGADGTYDAARPQDKPNLWWIDYLHASREGSYLDALVMFGAITGIDPTSFGANERARNDLGIAPADAIKLQRIASGQLTVAGIALTFAPCLHANRPVDRCPQRH